MIRIGILFLLCIFAGTGLMAQSFSKGAQAYKKGEYQEALEEWAPLAKGLPQAQYALGLMYSKGNGVKKDYRQAAYWYRKAADQNFTLAQFNLGLMYEYGNGVPKSKKAAIKWYRRAAALGDLDSQNRLDGLE